jgi:hypothetical protein
MTAKGYLAAFMLFFCSCAYASSGSGSIGIGTVSVRGNLRVDGYTVQGNGTLFDGTAVETGQATATLRLDNGTEITMAINSRGIVYRDRLVLLQGQSELKSSGSSFFLEADGLRVVPGGPNTLGVVSVSPENTVQVASLTGELRIVDDAGLSLAHVSPGTTMSFRQATGTGGAANGTSVTESGMVSVENGQYYLTTSDGTKYLLTGKDFQKYVGKKVVVVNGTLQTATTPSGISTIVVSSLSINGAAAGIFATTAGVVWFTTAVVAAGTGLGVGIYEATKPSSSP